MVVDVDVENKYILVSGNVPGAKNSYVFIREAIKGDKKLGAVELISYEELVNEPVVENEEVKEEVVLNETSEETAEEVNNETEETKEETPEVVEETKETEEVSE